MASWVGVVTNAGKSQFAAWVNGTTFHFDAAEGGSGTVAESALLAQTALANKRQDISIIGSARVEDGVKLTIQITAPQEGYTLNQIGIKGSVDGDTSVLCALFQSAEGVMIPSAEQTPDFVYKFFATVQLSNTGTFSVALDTSALVSRSELEEAIAGIDLSGYVPTTEKGAANGVATLDASGKVEAAQLPEMDYVPNIEKGAANGVATLDASGKVEASQLPEMGYIPTAEKGAAGGVATLDVDKLIPAGQLPIGGVKQFGAVKVTEGNGLIVKDGTISFQLSEVAVPAQDGTLTYTGAEQSPTWGGFDAEKMTISGELSGTEAGTYTVMFSLLSGFKWADGSTGSMSVTWTISRAVISDVPSQSGSLTYTGSALTPSWSNYDSTKMTVSGTTSATNAGSYTATFTPLSNYRWADGTTTAKSVTWTIGKATGSLTLSATSISIFGANGATNTFTVARTGDGTISVVSSKTSVATVSVSGTK